MCFVSFCLIIHFSLVLTLPIAKLVPMKNRRISYVKNKKNNWNHEAIAKLLFK